MEHKLKWKMKLSEKGKLLFRNTGYDVSVQTLNAGKTGGDGIRTTVGVEELQLNQLSPCRKYKITIQPRIKAEHIFGEGNDSDFQIIKRLMKMFVFSGTAGTAEFVESGREQTLHDVHCTHRGQTNLTLRWSATDECSKADNTTLKRMFRYSIRVRSGDSGGELEISRVDNYNETTVNLTDLEPNTVYEVEIRAQDANGGSSTGSVTWVGSTAVQLPAAPQDIEVNVDQNTFRLTWRPTSAAVGAHKINCHSSASDAQFAAIVSRGQNSLLVHEPPLRGNVTCRIRSSSEAGYGPPAEGNFRFAEQPTAVEDTSQLRHALYGAGTICFIAAVVVLILWLRQMSRRSCNPATDNQLRLLSRIQGR